jgi:hypothetical protein
MKPQPLQPSLGVIVGAIVGAVGGLFALGIAPAILTHDPSVFRATPVLSVLCWLISGGVGWVMGGQLGLRLNERFDHRNAGVAGGIAGGLIPIVLIALWGGTWSRRIEGWNREPSWDIRHAP